MDWFLTVKLLIKEPILQSQTQISVITINCHVQLFTNFIIKIKVLLYQNNMKGKLNIKCATTYLSIPLIAPILLIISYTM